MFQIMQAKSENTFYCSCKIYLLDPNHTKSKSRLFCPFHVVVLTFVDVGIIVLLLEYWMTLGPQTYFISFFFFNECHTHWLQYLYRYLHYLKANTVT